MIIVNDFEDNIEGILTRTLAIQSDTGRMFYLILSADGIKVEMEGFEVFDKAGINSGHTESLVLLDIKNQMPKKQD